MKWMLCVCVAWSMVVALTTAAEDLTECPSLTDEKLAELKTLVYSEDVHDKVRTHSTTSHPLYSGIYCQQF